MKTRKQIKKVRLKDVHADKQRSTLLSSGKVSTITFEKILKVVNDLHKGRIYR